MSTYVYPPISITPAPGGATGANQTLEIAQLTAINANTDGLETLVASTNTKTDTGNISLASIDSKITAVNTGAVVVSSSVLPTNAATSVLQTTGNTSISSIDTKTPALVNSAVPVQMNSTNFIASTNNSTVAQLAASATFTGIVETIFNQQSISLLVVSDQPGTLTINQYIDAAGLKVISSWPYSLAAGVPFSRAFAGNGNYFNLTFQNTGASTTTTLQVDTAYGTLPATTNLGNSNISINELNGAAIGASLPISTDQFLPVRQLPQKVFRSTFASAISNSIDSAFFTLQQTGSGMTVNQTGGNLLITSGITVNDETILRSVSTFKGPMSLRWAAILSQRIVNQNFYIELVDLIGDGLAYTINSATSVTVTIPSNPFTSLNIGQSLIMQKITGTAGTIPGRYAIASVAGNAVTFTVAGFPATGTGTMSLVGWNYIRATYNAAVATAITLETQRRGYNSNSTAFTATVNTTASPGHLAEVIIEDGQASLSDSLQAIAATLNMTRRAETIQSIPEETTPLYLQIHVLNGTVAPATTTTWTLGTVSLINRNISNVAVNSITNMSQNSQLPVTVLNTPTITGTVTVGSITAGANVIGNVGVGVVAVVDQTSLAITTTATGAAKLITNGASVSFTVNATIVSGTTPTYDFKVQESNDGTIWTDIWAAPRLTAVSSFVSPTLRIRGTQYRYVETISGTTPSFTRTISTARFPHAGELIRNILDRTIAPITTSSVTPSLYVEGCPFYALTVSQGAGGTAVQFAIDGSMDGTSWILGISSVTGIVSGLSQGIASGSFKFIRARVVLGVAATTIGYIQLEGREVALDISANKNGNSSGTTVLTGASATAITAPNGAIGFMLQNDPVSTVNLRYRLGGAVAATASGFVLQPGQDTGYIAGAPNLSLIAVSGTTSASYNLEWILR